MTCPLSPALLTPGPLSTSEVCRIAIRENPSDWVARLALADALENAGKDTESLQARSIAWAWAHLERLPAWHLCFIQGTGDGAKTAFFVKDWPCGHIGFGWEQGNYKHFAGPPGLDSLRLAFVADNYDTPGDHDQDREFYSVDEINAGVIPWLRSGRDHQGEPLLPVPAGSSVQTFCEAIDRAGGQWLYVP